MEHADLIINLPHCNVAAMAWGPINGIPILALHGWLDNAASFVPIAKYLTNYRLVAIDLPGHGLSSHSPNGTYLHFQDYIADIIILMEHFNWKTCGLLGHSLGAGLASLIAGTIPERISSLCMIDGIGALTASPEQLPKLMRETISEYSKLHKKKLTNYSSLDDAIKARGAASKMQHDSVRLLVERGTIQTDTGIQWRTDPRLLFPPLVMFTEDQITPFLREITAKSCLIRPTAGWPYDEEMFNTRVDRVRDLELIQVTGDHHVHMDAPDTIGPIIQQFLNKVYK